MTGSPFSKKVLINRSICKYYTQMHGKIYMSAVAKTARNVYNGHDGKEEPENEKTADLFKKL